MPSYLPLASLNPAVCTMCLTSWLNRGGTTYKPSEPLLDATPSVASMRKLSSIIRRELCLGALRFSNIIIVQRHRQSTSKEKSNLGHSTLNRRLVCRTHDAEDFFHTFSHPPLANQLLLSPISKLHGHCLAPGPYEGSYLKTSSKRRTSNGHLISSWSVTSTPLFLLGCRLR